MSPTLPQLACIMLLFQQTLSVSITCITQESSKSGSGQNAQTSVTCSNPDHTLVSCGFRHNNFKENDIIGSWIIGQTCYAANWDNSDSLGGVYAVARCCNLKAYQVTCRTLQSANTGPNDDDKMDIACDVDETLMGCTAKSETSSAQQKLDGSYPGARTDDIKTLAGTNQNALNVNKCTAWNAIDNTDGAHSYATCCKSADSQVTFECRTYYKDDKAASHDVTCGGLGVDEFMTSCSASSAHRDVNQWTVGNSDNTCYIRQARTVYDSQASGICCSIITASPTTATGAPTTTPTNPTNSPTNPTNVPTASTKSPSNVPTITPTMWPTQPPSISPSNAPSVAPSIAPSTTPSYSPTKSKSPTLSPTDVTANPTFAPSFAPNMQPSTSPTVLPTVTPVTTNYTVAIQVNKCDNELNTDINEQIKDALNNANVIITETTCDDGTVVVKLWIRTDPNHILGEDIIKDAIENEIEHDDRFGDVEVEVNDSTDIADKKNDTTNKEHMLSQILSDSLMFILLIVVVALLFIICCLLCVFVCVKRNKGKGKGKVMNKDIQLTRVTSVSAKESPVLTEITGLPNPNVEGSAGNGALDNSAQLTPFGNVNTDMGMSVSTSVVLHSENSTNNGYIENGDKTSDEDEMLYDNRKHKTSGAITGTPGTYM